MLNIRFTEKMWNDVIFGWTLAFATTGIGIMLYLEFAPQLEIVMVMVLGFNLGIMLGDVFDMPDKYLESLKVFS